MNQSHIFSFASAWERQVRERPSAVALRDARDGSTFTADELDLLLRRTATWLARQGLAPGDRLVLVASPEVETVLATQAALQSGVVPALLPAGAPLGAVVEVAEATAARRVLLATPDPRRPDALDLLALAEALPDLPALERPPEPDPASEAAILFSSGSTGAARGVRHSHRGLVAGSERLAALVAPCGATTIGLPALLHTITGLRWSLLAPTLIGGSAALLSPRAGPAQLLAECAASEVEAILVGPGFVRAFNLAFEHLRDLVPPRLRAAIVLGGALSDEDRRRFCENSGLALLYTYGTTETAGAFTGAWTWPDGRAEAGVGRSPAPVRILREDDQPAAPGEVGQIEILVEAPFLGYLDGGGPAPRAGAGWVRPGDLGRLDEDGALHVLGRVARQLVAPSGEKVLLDELDRILGDLLGVEVVTAVVERAGRAPRIGALVARDTPGELWLAGARAALAGRLPPEAIPSIWAFMPALPRLPNGKPDLEAARGVLMGAT